MHASGVSDLHTDNSKEATIPESANAYNTTNSSPKPPPRLSSSKSAPTAEMEAMISQTSPSQHAYHPELTRAQSFHGFVAGFEGGDTQPMESQVYRNYTESMMNATTPKKVLLRAQISPNGKTEYQMETVDEEMSSVHEGESGFVNLDYTEPSPGAQSDASHASELLRSPETQLPAQQIGLPETPSIAGNKRKRDSDVDASAVTTNKKTPGLTQLFGGPEKSNAMTATQLFNQTQAPSSPLPEGARSDPVITRPSPNLQHQFSVSSPSIMTSSPVITRNGRLSLMPGDPSENYRSLKESQEARARKLRGEWGESDRFNEHGAEFEIEGDDRDDSQTSEQWRLEKKMLQRVRSENAINEMREVRASSRPGSRPGSRPTSSPKKQVATIDLVTPATVKVAGRVKISLSDDIDVEDEDGAEQDQPMVDAVDIEADGEQDDADEYDELAQEVLRSQGPADDQDGEEAEDDEEVMSVSGSARDDEGLPDTIRDAGFPADINQLQGSQANSNARQNTGRELATQPSAIADSQPQQRDTSKASSTPHRRAEEGALHSSFVPGSQYTGRTSIDQAVIPSRSHTSRPDGASQDRDKIPSSPPLALLREESEGAIVRALQGQARGAHQLSKQTSSIAELEVPESDFAAPDATDPRPPSRAGLQRGETDSNQLFSTARSHVSASGPQATAPTLAPSRFKALISQQSKTASQTPRTAAGVRHFADIADAASPPKGSGETEVDIDAIMSDIITADDERVFDVMESPSSARAQKRRKTMHTIADVVESPVKRTRSRAKPRARFETAPVPELSRTPPTAVVERPNSPPPVLQDAPSKANERRRATPPVQDVPESTPDSVKQREEAGAKLASQLLSRRSSRAPKPSTLAHPKKSATGVSKRSRVIAPSSDVDAEEQTAVVEETTMETRTETVDAEQSDIIHESIVEDDQAPDAHDAALRTDKQPKINKTLQFDGSNRVLALFKGSYNNFYPATWLNTTPDGRKYRVRFEDGNITSLDTKHVRKFELRAGDVVRVDLPELKGKTWVVDRLGRTAQTEEDAANGFDCHGHITVHVATKASRASTADTNVTNDKDEETIEVATSSIYLLPSMWARFSDRNFAPQNRHGSRPATPSNGMQTPDTDTPTSRSRRTTVLTTKVLSARPSNLREESVMSSSPSDHGQGLFANMAFAISYGSNEVERTEVSRLIVRNGGLLLEQGFDELFELPKLENPTSTSPTKTNGRVSVEDDSDDTGLVLKSQYDGLGFVALIADKHSRRAKYVQALALGLPTLSGRWIADSLNATKNPSGRAPEPAPLPWSRYLLPAGESAYLGHAIRSRAMAVYPASEAKLSTTIANRDILLNSDGVLIVASKKSKAVWERRKAYAFLTLALGAGGVKRVSDVAEAKVFAAGEGSRWKWVYVDGSVADASKAMFPGSNEGVKKRKRDAGVAAAARKVDVKAMSAGDGRVTIVNDEFVVQSLILGALVD